MPVYNTRLQYRPHIEALKQGFDAWIKPFDHLNRGPNFTAMNLLNTILTTLAPAFSHHCFGEGIKENVKNCNSSDTQQVTTTRRSLLFFWGGSKFKVYIGSLQSNWRSKTTCFSSSSLTVRLIFPKVYGFLVSMSPNPPQPTPISRDLHRLIFEKTDRSKG